MARNMRSIINSQVGRGVRDARGLSLRSAAAGKTLTSFVGTRRSAPSSNVRRLPNAAGAFHLPMALVSEPFVREVDALLKNRAPDLIAKTLIAIMAKLLGLIRMRTPVDTGMARATWQIALAQVQGSGRGGSASLKARSRPTRDSKGRFVKRRPVKAKGAAANPARWIEVAREVYPAVKGLRRQRVAVTNSLPYILPLEYGWSGQAPLGMVRISIAQMRGLGPQQIAKLFRAAWLAAALSASKQMRPYVKRFRSKGGGLGRIKEAGVTWA